MKDNGYIVWLAYSYLLLMFSGFLLVPRALEKRLKAKNPATRPYRWGFLFGCFLVAQAPFALLCAVQALAAGLGSRGDEFGLDLAMAVVFTINAVSGWFVIRRKRWAWVAGTVLDRKSTRL